jgi:hypothetical protein
MSSVADPKLFVKAELGMDPLYGGKKIESDPEFFETLI